MNLVYYFFLHFVADFILQSREMGKKKSEEIRWLVAHISIVFLVFLVGTWDISFSFLNAGIHMVIDAAIWKLYSLGCKWRWDKIAPPSGLPEDFKYYEDPWFYTTIGFDQFLHMATIVLLLEYL